MGKRKTWPMKTVGGIAEVCKGNLTSYSPLPLHSYFSHVTLSIPLGLLASTTHSTFSSIVTVEISLPPSLHLKGTLSSCRLQWISGHQFPHWGYCVFDV